MAIKLIIGLRNPGPTYEYTRHNAGAWFAERLLKQIGGQFNLDKKHQAQISHSEYEGQLFYIALPNAFMNHNGRAVRSIANFYKLSPTQILIAHDELDLEPGRIKLKTGGGHGGHNGLKDVISQLGSSEFHRLRIGIGHPGHKDLVSPFVLQQPSANDKRLIYDAIERSIYAFNFIVNDDMAKAMTLINS